MQPMKQAYTAIIQRDDKWWIGWIEEIRGVNAQARTRAQCIENLRGCLREALEMNREEARRELAEDHEELELVA
jgi:predicted RNase H-like HicB family nuclease